MAVGDSVEVSFEATGADEITSELEELISQFEAVEKAGDIDLDNFTSALEEGGAAGEELNASIEPLGASLETMGGSAETAGGALSSLSSEVGNTTSVTSEFQAASQEAATSVDELASGISPLAGVLGEAAGATTEVSSGLTETAGAMSETEGAAGALSTIVTETGGSLTEMAGSTAETVTGLEEVTTGTETAATGFETFNTATTETATQMETLNTGMVDTGTAVEELGASTETASTGIQSFNENIDLSIGFMGNAAGSAVGLVTGFVRLEQSQNRVQRSTIQVSKAQETLEKAQAKLVQLQTSGSATATELANAQRDVEQASDTLSQKQGALEIQQANLNLRMTDFYATIGPNIITTITSIIAGVSQMPQAFGRIANSLSNAAIQTDSYTISSEGASQATSEFGLDLDTGSTSLNTFGNDVGTTTSGLTSLNKGLGSSLKVFGVVGAVIGVASVALGLYATNTFHAKDAIDGFGEALGNAVPPLEGALVAVQNFAVDIGIAGESAKAQVSNVQSFEESVVALGDNIIKTGDQFATSGSEMEKAFGQNMQRLGQSVKTQGAELVKEVSGWGAALDEFLKAAGEKDYDKMWELIVAGAKSVGIVIFDLLTIAGDAVGVAIETAAGFVADVFNNIGGIIAAGWQANVVEPILDRAEEIQQAFITTFGKAGENLAAPFVNAGTSITAAFTALGQALTKQWATFVSNAQTVAQGIGDAFNSTVDWVKDISQLLWDKLGLEKLTNQAFAVAGQIGKAFSDAIAAGGKLIGMPQTEEDRPTPHQIGGQGGRGTDVSTMGDVGQGPRNLQETNKELQTYNDLVPESAAVTATLTSRFGDNLARGNQLKTSYAGLVGGFNAAEGSLSRTVGGFNAAEGALNNFNQPVSTAASRLGDYIKAGAAAQGANASLATSAVPVIDNFQAARNIMPGFNEALASAQVEGKATGDVIGALPPEFSAYGQAIQTAADHNVRLSNAVLASKPATIAFSEALASNTGEFEKNFGAASGYIAAMGQTEHITGLSQQGVINYAAALKAGGDEIKRITTGQQEANAATLGVQAAYASMTPEVVASAVGFQKEAQALALGNILRADTARGTIALAEATTKGVEKGVEFANTQFTAAASLQGYRAGLSEAISGNTEYGNSLGLTTGQLERQLSFTNDVVAAQEKIIDTVDEQNNAFTVNAEAWRTMNDAQIENLETSLETRLAQEQSRDAFAATNENITAQKLAFIDGTKSAKDFGVEIANATANYRGFREGLIQNLVALNNQTGAISQAAQTHLKLSANSLTAKKNIEGLEAQMDILFFTAGKTAEEIQALNEAFAATPAAISALAQEVGGLVDEFVGMLEFQGDEDEIFGDFDLGDKVPEEFRRVTNDAQEEWGKGVAQMQRQAELMGPAIGVSLGHAMDTLDLSALQEKGPEMADALREGWDGNVPPVVEHMAQTFEKLGTIGDTITADNIESFTGMATSIVQDLNRMQNPAQMWIHQLVEMGKKSDLSGAALQKFNASLATMPGGLEELSAQGESVALTLGTVGQKAGEGQVPIVELTDAASGVTTKFANFNGQMLPVQTGLSALVGPAQLAGNALLGVGAFANAVVIRFGDIQEALANTGTVLGLFKTVFETAFVIMSNIFASFITIALAHVTTLNTYFAITLPASLLIMQTAFTNAFVIMNNTFASFITIALAHITTLNTYFAVTLPTSLLTMTTAFTNAFVIMNNTFASFITIALAHITTLNTYFATTLPASLTTAQTAFSGAFTTMSNVFGSFISIAGAHVTTINTYFTQTIPQAVQTGAAAFTTGLNAMSTSVLTLRNNVQTAASDITSSLDEISSAAADMASEATGSFNATSTSALTLRNNIDQMSSDSISAMEEMASTASSTSSDIVSSFGDIQSAAEDATSAVEDLKSAIDSLEDKTVTITVKYDVQKPPSGLQHGGAFIASHPMNLSGVNIAEHHKPELVTVTPLSNPSVIGDRTINAGRLTAATSTGMQGGGKIIRATTQDNNETVKILVTEVRNLQKALAEQKIIANFFMDSRLVDQQIQKVRHRRQEAF
jgi:methyl-accepting chemotaxis protein